MLKEEARSQAANTASFYAQELQEFSNVGAKQGRVFGKCSFYGEKCRNPLICSAVCHHPLRESCAPRSCKAANTRTGAQAVASRVWEV